ncbi:hypothetical protein C8F04DRAFT_587636 [Mycena alexandri]|uniref:Uncharacterized protein n=1 Tax=Mycena alexandri TaxID=1745969 RepID=A0AAD6TIG0_9AGAR|nr:hypothetical protein C8F04DRAFT_587636 [Mycena alexandri]
MARPSSPSLHSAENSEGDSNIVHLVDKLDSLAKFYQKQLDWVDRTARVAVRVAETDSDCDLSEPDKENITKSPTAAAVRRMRWRKQMRSLETKLNGKTTKRRRNSVDVRSRRTADEEMRSHHILQMFGEMMGTRMESCRRVQKLVASKKARTSLVLRPDEARGWFGQYLAPGASLC